MKKNCIAVLVLLFISAHLPAQVVAKPVKKVATLSMPGENGANGASVVWHPVLKKYYASFAGNATFPLAVFDATGKLLSSPGLETMIDVRGMWYNTVSKKIEANGYDDGGWVSYVLDAKGIPGDIVQLQEGQMQPDVQSVGVFDAVKKRVCFLFEGSIIAYSLKGEPLDEGIELKKSDKPELEEGELEDVDEPAKNYNATGLCYTGIVNAEFGVLNHGAMQIELYNRKGILTKAFKLPEDIALYTNFNFAYANGTWWLFDKDERKWFGFK
ncbi:MAG: hypothetical protein H7Y01_09965 [Ferruginibacter sp.]|nr:hypothetical protein [Chitinophagaceae bacterium]